MEACARAAPQPPKAHDEEHVIVNGKMSTLC
jgi:hypothetical protein